MSARRRNWKDISHIVNLWAQTVAIAGAGIWAFYTFVYKEIEVPRSEVGHVSGNASIRIVGENKNFIAVEVAIDLQNNSRKQVTLLSGLVEVVGFHFEQELTKGSLDNVPREVIGASRNPVLRGFDARKSRQVLMLADPFRNSDLGAGEKRASTLLLHLDPSCCDYLELFAFIPFIYNDLPLLVEWQLVEGEVRQHLILRESEGGGRRLNLKDVNDQRWLNENPYNLLRLRQSLSLWPQAEISLQTDEENTANPRLHRTAGHAVHR